MANPIKASDLYQDDGALKRLLEELQQVSKALDGLKGEAVQLTVATKKMNATNADGREEIARAAKQADELEKKYKKYNDSLTQNAREIAAVQEAQTKLNQINRAEARLALAKEGSYNALSAQYSLLKLRLNQMTRAERDNTAEGRKMVAQAKEIYEEMKRLQEETGKTALNVGNYKESIKEALQETGLFPGVLGQVAGQLKSMSNALMATTQAINFNSRALTVFSRALVATGIGAIVVALGTLVTILTRTQSGVDWLNRKLAGISAVSEVFVSKIAEIAKALKTDFSGEVKKATTNVGNFFSAIIRGDRASFIAQITKAGQAFKDFSEDISEANTKGQEYEAALQAIKRETIDLEARTASARAEIKRLNFIAEDTTRSYNDRAQAAAAAGAIERKLLEEREALLQREIVAIRARNNEFNPDGLISGTEEIADKERELAQVKAESLELQTTINNKLNIINAEAARTAKALNDELKDSAAILGGPAEVARREYEKAIEAIDELTEKAKLIGLNENFDDKRLLELTKYQRKIDELTLSTKELTTSGLQPLASSTAQAGNELDDVRQIAGKTAENAQGLSIGFRLSKEGADALKGAFGQAKAQVGEFFQQQQQLAEFQLQQAQQGVQAAQNELQIQLQLAAAGYANRVDTAQQELALAKRTQEEAEKQRQRAQRAQLIAQSVEQASNLVTAISKLWVNPGFPLALPATALLFSTFAAAKIKAFQATKLFSQGGFEVLEGGSHASGRDVPLFTGRDGVQRRAEGGEGMAIFSRQATGKYGGMLPDLVQAINRGEFELKYSALNHAADGLPMVGGIVNVNTTGVESRLDALRRDGRERTYTDGRGRVVRVIGNRKITYV